MSKQYVGAEPLTMVRIGSGESATMVYVFAGAPVPDGADPDDVKRLVDEGFLVAQDADVDEQADDSKPASVSDILTEVGDDKAKATAALEQEQARGDAARKTLVEKLQAIAKAE